ncbi:MAG: DNA polymerase III subunit delta [Gemmatimonadota bacterium]|nr:DNA polymerase III subunit delta [Gemmatimonadota bacterium]
MIATEAAGGAFYLHGEDHFRKEEALRDLIELHADPATRDFNVDHLNGAEVDAETLASILATPPMMATWRVVVLREVEKLAGSKHTRDALLEVVRSPPEGLALLMSCTVPSRSKAKIYKELAKLPRAKEFPAVSDADLPGWVVTRAREVHGVDFEIEAARALGAAIGSDLGVLAREVDKLTEFVGEKKRVTVEDVRAVGTRVPSQDRWKWFDLVGNRRFDEARASLGALFIQGETGVGLVIGLATHLLRIGVVLESGREGLEKALPPYQRWLAKNVVPQARGWSRDDLDRALLDLREVDRLLKASSHEDEHFLETWLLGMRVRQEAA